MTYVFIFTIIQLINVITSTVKSIVTIKGGKGLASIVSAISYGFNVIVVKQIAGIDDIWMLFLVTVVTNLIGVYVSKYILDKLRKDQLWKISATVLISQAKQLMEDLDGANLGYIKFGETNYKRTVIDIFSYTKEDSKKIKEIFHNYSVKYTISSNKTWL